MQPGQRGTECRLWTTLWALGAAHGLNSLLHTHCSSISKMLDCSLLPPHFHANTP